jgi:Creatinase/Prolidase N-terminal domain
MHPVRLIDIELPDFGIPDIRPELPAALYYDRLARLRERAKETGLDAIIIYADREHSANIAYLTGFEPRFEEALLILAGNATPILITGPENQGYAPISPLELDVRLYPPFGLLGQDRRKTLPLTDVLSQTGLAKGMTIGVAGWKYYGPLETPTPDTWLETPSFIVDTLRTLVGLSGKITNATRLLMDASKGLRAINEIDQLAQFEFSACHVSEALKRILHGVKPGMREFEAASLMQPIGLPLSCHAMLGSGKRASLGLVSPSSQKIERGTPFFAALGVWGALCCRAGWMVADESELPANVADYLDKLAKPYFACVAEWYETIGIGITGGAIDALVKRHLGDPFFGVFLNPGHLIHLDEWMNSPIYEGSEERLQSGQAIQVDIIPATNSPYFTINVEDGIALLDERGRAEFSQRYPGAWRRIEARRAFMKDILGIRLKPEVLPFSNLAAALPPLIMSPSRVLAKTMP